jgi:hypothetical protein
MLVRVAGGGPESSWIGDEGTIVTDQVLVQEWQPFFIALAGASAALAGLVFVAMSLHPQPTLGNPLTRARAYAAAFGFLLGVAWALIMLMPARTASVRGLLLIAVGAGGIIFVAYQQLRIRKAGMNVARAVLSDILVLTPIVAGLVELLQPGAELPFVLLALASGVGLFVLFGTSWTLVMHSVNTTEKYATSTNAKRAAIPTFQEPQMMTPTETIYARRRAPR